MILPAGGWLGETPAPLLLGWALMCSPAQCRYEVLPTVSQSGSILDLTRCPSSDPLHFSEEFGYFLVVIGQEYLHDCFWLHGFFLWVFLGLFYLLILLVLVCSIDRKFFWLNLIQGPSQACGQIQLNLKRNGYEFHSLGVWSLLIIDTIALLIIRSIIKLSLPLHLWLEGCSRVWSLNGSSQTKIRYHIICKHQSIYPD